MKTLTKNIATKVTEAGVFFGTFLPVAAHAEEGASTGNCASNEAAIRDGSAGIGGGAQCGSADDNVTSLFGDGGIFNTIANVLIFLIGAVSVIVLIYGGFQYVTSTGDSKRVENAKNTILYAIIGIVVALLAFAIVQFVVGSLANTSATN